MEKSVKNKAAPSQALIIVVAISVGALAANLYYAQPLIASIGASIGVGTALSGSLVSVTQIGYGAGLFFLVSLADLVENRRLVLIAVGIVAASLVGVGISQTAAAFFIASLVMGVCASAAQILVPFVAHLAPPERRGRVVGLVMGGLLTGIMLARPAALFIAGSFGWRAVFLSSAVLTLVIGAALARAMPYYRPRPGLHYGQVLASMLGILRERPAVRWRAIYQSLMFCAFNLFWTTVPLLLAQRFKLSEHAVALFALAGSGGALAAPIAGHLADRGHIAAATAGAMAVLALSFAGAIPVSGAIGLVSLTLLAVLIDAAVQINQVTGQHIIFSVPGEIRGRVNAIYMTTVFIGGAFGSVLGTLLYAHAGWTATAACGAFIGVLASSLHLIERAQARGVQA
ncbi:MAG: MFS transporter [Pseudomonadota bacterium]